MQLAEPAAYALAENARKGGRLSLDHRDLEAQPSSRGCDLLADEAGPDDCEPAPRDELGPQALDVEDSAHRVHVPVAA